MQMRPRDTPRGADCTQDFTLFYRLTVTNVNP